MEYNENIQFFKNMLLDCCGLWGWTWNKDFELIDTNYSGQSRIVELQWAQQRMEVIKQHMENSRMPMMLGSKKGMSWIVVFQEDEFGEVEAIHVLGPVFQSDISDQILENSMCHFHIFGSEKQKIIESIRKIPVISTVHMFQYAIFLHYSVTGTRIGVNDLVHFEQDTMMWKLVSGVDTSPHAPGLIQSTLIDIVRTGNLDYHNVLAQAISSSYGIRMQETEPLQQAKYSVTIFVGLSIYGAIEGGLPSETAFNLCDTYVTAVEQCKTISELTAVSHTMYDDLVHRVNKLQSGEISREIWTCRDYIIAHVEEKISFKNLAKIVGYEEYYMSRKFKKEMGMSLNEFINKTKIQRAKRLLTVTNMSVEDVATQLQFSSRSYFTDAFQKSEGMSPSNYREMYAKENQLSVQKAKSWIDKQ